MCALQGVSVWVRIPGGVRKTRQWQAEVTSTAPPPFFTVDRVVAGATLIVAAPASLLTLGTAAMTKVHFSPTAAAHFEERVGRPLMTPAVLAAGATVVAAGLLLSTVRGPRPLLAWLSALLSVLAIGVSLDATADHRRRSDPRPELARELQSLNLGPDAAVVLRSSRPLPDLPEVRWVYRVPLRRTQACALARAALETWADRGVVATGRDSPCDFNARRAGSAVSVYVAPEGAPLTRPPDDDEKRLDTLVHYVMVEISACTGFALPCTRPRSVPSP